MAEDKIRSLLEEKVAGRQCVQVDARSTGDVVLCTLALICCGHGKPGPAGPARPSPKKPDPALSDAAPGPGSGLDFELEGRARAGPVVFAFL